MREIVFAGTLQPNGRARRQIYSQRGNPLRNFLVLSVAVIFVAAGAAGYIWYDLIRMHGREIPVAFQSKDGTTLRGEIYVPKGNGPFPGVVVLHGSGPHTADMAPYKLNANAFLKKGVAVLLYDKRGAGRSGGDFDTATYADFIEDALAAVRTLRARPDIADDKIGLFGSSEGGWFTPEVSVRDGRIRFIVNRAGPPLPWIDTNLWEIRNELIDGGITDQTLISKILDLRIKIWTYYRDAANADDPLPDRRAKLAATLQALDGPWRDVYNMQLAEFDAQKYRRWCIDIFYDPTPFLEEMTTPLLALFSSDDQNVPTAKAVPVLERLRDEDGKDITIIVYQGRKHSMFKWYNIFTGGYPRRYLDTIGGWAKKQSTTVDH